LVNNQITSLPPEIGFLINLSALFINESDLTTIPSSLSFLLTLHNVLVVGPLPPSSTISPKDALISIYSANPGNTLGWGVDNYPEVGFDANGNPKTITINNKNITRIPDNIDQLTGLENLNVNNNNLEAIPSSIGNINTLVILTLASNQLSTVPSELGQLTGLALLSLTSNPITSIPTEVCDLQTSNGGILTIISDAGEGCN
jgi:Leucine-rich repeat (LRR) protein